MREAMMDLILGRSDKVRCAGRRCGGNASEHFVRSQRRSA